MQASSDGDCLVFSVADLIGFAANVLGGIHYCDPRTEAETRLMEIAHHRGQDESGLGMVRPTLIQITSVVLAGLEPLETAILAS